MNKLKLVACKLLMNTRRTWLENIKAEIRHLEANKQWLEDHLAERARLVNRSVELQQQDTALTADEHSESEAIAERLLANRTEPLPQPYRYDDVEFIDHLLQQLLARLSVLEPPTGPSLPVPQPSKAATI
jgi:hypothetical protein